MKNSRYDLKAFSSAGVLTNACRNVCLSMPITIYVGHVHVDHLQAVCAEPSIGDKCHFVSWQQGPLQVHLLSVISSCTTALVAGSDKLLRHINFWVVQRVSGWGCLGNMCCQCFDMKASKLGGPAIFPVFQFFFCQQSLSLHVLQSAHQQQPTNYSIGNDARLIWSCISYVQSP